MKNWKKAIALVASAAALVSVAACGPSNAGGSSDSGKKTVGFVAVGPEGGFRTANEKDIQKAFEDAGFDLTYSPTQNNDQQKQIQAFNKFVNDEVDAIILSSTEDSGWDDSLKKAAEAEIPVFTVDRNVDVKDAEAKKAIVAHIGPSNVWCGEQAAEFVNKNFPDGANGFILEGPAGLSVVKDRGTGWGNKVASNVKVLESQSANWSTDEAKTVTAGLLDKYKSDNPQFIFAQNDEMGLGAAQAVDAAGLKGKVKIITIDGTKNALQALVDGDLSYVIEYNPIFGKETAQAVKDYLDGKTVEKDIEIESKTFDAALLGEGAAERWTQMLQGLRATLAADGAKYAQKLGQWIYYGKPIGDFGTEYTYRAMVALVGLGANTVDVAIYPKTAVDETGAALTGEKKYTLHFETLPPTLEGGFWSVTAYGEDDFLIDNSIDRYCINDRSDFKLNADGTLDIILSKDAPEDTSNWLPVSDGEFHLFMRIYVPDMTALDSWQPPVIREQ